MYSLSCAQLNGQQQAHRFLMSLKQSFQLVFASNLKAHSMPSRPIFASCVFAHPLHRLSSPSRRYNLSPYGVPSDHPIVTKPALLASRKTRGYTSAATSRKDVRCLGLRLGCCSISLSFVNGPPTIDRLPCVLSPRLGEDSNLRNISVRDSQTLNADQLAM